VVLVKKMKTPWLRDDQRRKAHTVSVAVGVKTQPQSSSHPPRNKGKLWTNKWVLNAFVNQSERG